MVLVKALELRKLQPKITNLLELGYKRMEYLKSFFYRIVNDSTLQITGHQPSLIGDYCNLRVYVTLSDNDEPDFRFETIDGTVTEFTLPKPETLSGFSNLASIVMNEENRKIFHVTLTNDTYVHPSATWLAIGPDFPLNIATSLILTIEPKYSVIDQQEVTNYLLFSPPTSENGEVIPIDFFIAVPKPELINLGKNPITRKNQEPWFFPRGVEIKFLREPDFPVNASDVKEINAQWEKGAFQGFGGINSQRVTELLIIAANYNPQIEAPQPKCLEPVKEEGSLGPLQGVAMSIEQRRPRAGEPTPVEDDPNLLNFDQDGLDDDEEY